MELDACIGANYSGAFLSCSLSPTFLSSPPLPAPLSPPNPFLSSLLHPSWFVALLKLFTLCERTFYPAYLVALLFNHALPFSPSLSFLIPFFSAAALVACFLLHLLHCPSPLPPLLTNKHCINDPPQSLIYFLEREKKVQLIMSP